MAAKSNKGSEVIGKLKFGKKSKGKMKKRFGPKEEKPKAYQGQGR